jgi:peptidoglycan/xylan/chitin deacetylase (PgdA/CDA1 family)
MKLAEPEKLATIERLAAAAHVELPERPPRQYAPMTWDQVRDLERRGMRFGPHTVTHPILTRTSADESRREIADSWRRLREEAEHPVPVFCYPNGQVGDYGDREISVLRGLGFTGAVVGTIGYADAPAFRASPEGPFRVRRFGYPHELTLLAQSVSGLERISRLVRGQA